MGGLASEGGMLTGEVGGRRSELIKGGKLIGDCGGGGTGASSIGISIDFSLRLVLGAEILFFSFFFFVHVNIIIPKIVVPPFKMSTNICTIFTLPTTNRTAKRFLIRIAVKYVCHYLFNV